MSGNVHATSKHFWTWGGRLAGGTKHIFYLQTIYLQTTTREGASHTRGTCTCDCFTFATASKALAFEAINQHLRALQTHVAV